MVAVGDCPGVVSAKRGGVITFFDDVNRMTDKFAIGCETDTSLHFIRKTDYGYVVVGHVKNSLTGKQDILLLGLDEEFKIIKRAMAGGEKDETVTSVDISPKGDILVCGLTTSAGAGGNDVMAIRFDKDFQLTKQFAFGGSGNETSPFGIINSDGSITLVGSIPNIGAGGGDAFIATISGNWKELTGSLTKYPSIVLNGKPGFKILNTDFDISVNKTTTIESGDLSLGTTAVNYLANKDIQLIVDANAITQE